MEEKKRWKQVAFPVVVFARVVTFLEGKRCKASRGRQISALIGLWRYPLTKLKASPYISHSCNPLADQPLASTPEIDTAFVVCPCLLFYLLIYINALSTHTKTIWKSSTDSICFRTIIIRHRFSGNRYKYLQTSSNLVPDEPKMHLDTFLYTEYCLLMGMMRLKKIP